MSLINDMLRNLEAKRPDDLAKQNLQREIRSLPPPVPARGSALKWLLLVGLPALGIAAGVLHANGQLLPWLGMEPAVVPAVITAPAPVLVPPPPPAVVAPPVIDAQPAVLSDTLKLAQDIAVLPTPAAPVVAIPDPVAPPLKADVSSAKAEPELAKSPSPASAPAGPVRIEKSPVLATAHERAELEYRRAEAALAGGRSTEAQEALRAALKLDASFVQARQALLRQLLDMRKLDEAITVLQEGLELQPVQTGWAVSLARLQMEQGDVAAADRTLIRSQAYAESNADYAGFQGHLKTRLGANRQAAAHYQRATRLAPNEGRWWLGLGLALEADGRPAEAREALRRSLATATLSAELAAIAEQHLR